MLALCYLSTQPRCCPTNLLLVHASHLQPEHFFSNVEAVTSTCPHTPLVPQIPDFPTSNLPLIGRITIYLEII